MGKYDSSKYRVKPLMNFIGNDYTKFNNILQLVKCDGIQSMPDIRIDRIDEITYTDADVSKKERSLKPLQQHLDAMKILELKQELRAIPPVNSKLEANSYPDIFIETDKYIIVVESKWTESTTTTQTTYLKKRDQLIRHIEGAINYSPDKEVFAFYIVDESFLKSKKNQERLSYDGFIATVHNEIVQKGNIEEKIISSYKGYTTWQELDLLFGKDDLLFKTKAQIDEDRCKTNC